MTAARWPFTEFSPAMAAAMFDHHHEGVLIASFKGLMVYYNKRMSELDKLEPEDVLGRHLLDVYNLDSKNCMSLRCLTSGRPIVNAALYYRAHKGGLVNALCNAYPLYEKGRLMGCICYTSEYTSLADRLDKTARNYARHPFSRHVDDDHTKSATNGAIHTLASIIGESQGLKSALETAKVAAKTTSSVMICGETGTGKELFAQAIHNHSPRRAGLFCPINCAAIPENLLEGILFGTVKGSFTGSMERPGLFETSSGGTIFLDEIHAMPMGLQAKLLRVLQERKIRRVGSLKETAVDLKVVSSINQRPEEAMAAGLLRPDLFYRLGVVILNLPPLSRRSGDVGELVKFFVKKYNDKFHGRVKYIEPEFLSIMENYCWPGNVRELEHVVETSMNFAVGDPINNASLGLRHIQSAHLRKFLVRREVPGGAAGPPDDDQAAEAALDNFRRAEAGPKMAAGGLNPPLNHGGALPLLGVYAPPQNEGGHSFAAGKGASGPGAFNQELAGAEKKMLALALEKSGGNISKAARSLGISRQSLYYKLKKHPDLR
ncbi:sigma 54-interacting transcriptional regulator [Deltaproteobacteria bacterium OttesenSCG-928-K17]|nr:sigma 54-interacting transcriptional regulator [Deltaproteobacteria bacterium OttesenSCG-928-K17]